MDFTSYTYLAFLAGSAVLLRFLGGRAREFCLLCLSLLFYGFWDPRFIIVLLGLGAWTYFAGRQLLARRGRRGVLTISLSAVLLTLAVFKYSGMVAGLANHLLPAAARLPIPSIVLPLGISFYTFECASYLLDIYKGGTGIAPFHRFLLFPAFWPHLVAGPILRTKEFAPQLEHPKRASGPEVVAGVDRLLMGLLKKTVIANSLAPFVDHGFSTAANSALDDWVLAIAFGMQIYFDFSAYTDIAIGSARMIGFDLPENFNLPYHAASPTDFWNRWHITLSRWIRDYLFFPLNLKAGRRIWLRYVYLVLVMGLVGLWHGAGLAFILWGLWHGLLMTAHRILQGQAKGWPQALLSAAQRGGALLTFLLVNAGWVLFRTPSIGQGAGMLRTMAELKGLKPAFSANDYLLIIAALGFYFLVEPLLQRVRQQRAEGIAAEGSGFWLRPVAYGLALMTLFMFDSSNVAFIYFQF